MLYFSFITQKYTRKTKQDERLSCFVFLMYLVCFALLSTENCLSIKHMHKCDWSLDQNDESLKLVLCFCDAHLKSKGISVQLIARLRIDSTFKPFLCPLFLGRVLYLSILSNTFRVYSNGFTGLIHPPIVCMNASWFCARASIGKGHGMWTLKRAFFFFFYYGRTVQNTGQLTHRTCVSCVLTNDMFRRILLQFSRTN